MQQSKDGNKNEFSCKNPEFFMAVCTFKNHSYVIIGARDSETKQQFVLANFGRYPQGIMPEKMPRSEKGTLIDIQAFDLSIEQYRQVAIFLTKQNKQLDGKISFAIPKEWVNNQSLENEKKLEKLSRNIHLENSSEEKTEINKNLFVFQNSYSDKSIKMDDISLTGGLSFSNNCRTNAKNITQKIIKSEDLPGVSSWFFKSLPFKARLSQGFIKDPLFIYPLPPITKKQGVNEKQWDVLRKIYKRMDIIAKSSKSKDLDESHKKFDALKNLYQKQYKNLTQNKPLDFASLLTNIKEWAKSNDDIIDTKRSSSFFNFKTTTRKMIDEIVKEESKEQKTLLIPRF